jgi:hypothetical protein
MQRLKTAILLSGLFLTAPLFAAETASITDYLPKTEEVAGTIMKIEIPKDYLSIMQKLQQAVQAQQPWFMEYAKNAKPNEPLPYDPKMGITKEEYRVISAPNKNIRFVADQKITLSFIKQEGGKIKIRTQPTSPLDNIVLDDKAGITTPYGDLKNVTMINYTDKNSPTGAWKGVQWKLESIDQEKRTAKAVKFAIGKMENNQQNLLYYDVLEVNNDQKERFDFIVFYPRS